MGRIKKKREQKALPTVLINVIYAGFFDGCISPDQDK
jgi:hypothetical protein